jgi:S1/P1 Nuclease
MTDSAAKQQFRLIGVWAILLATPALAWGPQGHQTVGAIADSLIAGTHAATQVHSILGTETLQTAALWADCAKGVTEKPPYRFVVNPQYSECAPFQTTSGKQAMVAYVTRNLSDCMPTAHQEVCHKQYHYADVAIERDHYARSEVGTSDHDIVSAIAACIAVLQGHTSPAPIHIQSKKEALRLLAHFVGDLHQPLHVGAIYLGSTGHEVDPDMSALIPDSETQGGNLIKHGSRKLHSEWDGVPASLDAAAFVTQGAQLAQAVPVTPGAPTGWPIAWASETVVVSHQAFAALSYGPELHPGTQQRSWPVTEPAGYAGTRASLQKAQIVKAGARLSQLLQAIWP